MELIEYVSPYKFDGKHRGVRIHLSFSSDTESAYTHTGYPVVVVVALLFYVHGKHLR